MARRTTRSAMPSLMATRRSVTDAPPSAGRLGLPVRIGLEDVLTDAAGQPVTGNADLVRLALGVWSAAGGGGGADSAAEAG